jgi:hypothetical protein
MHMRRLLPIIAAAVAAAAIPASAQAAPPPNDAFATAQPLTLDVPVTGTIVEATVEPGEPAHAGDRRTRSVWYSYTPAADGAVTLDACDASFDDVIATYTGGAINALTAGPSVDDACNDLGARVSLQVKAGVTTWIAISGVEDDQGTFTLVARPETLPRNDAFVDAIALRPGRVQGSNVLATRELGDPELTEGGGGSVWYRYRTGQRQRVTLDTTNSSFDTVLGVYTGDLGSLRRIATNDDGGPGDTSQLSFTAVARRTYWILVDGFENARGSFELGLSDGSIAGYGVTLAPPESTVLSDVLARGLRTTVGCRRTCRLELQARVSQATARRIGLPRSAGRVLARTTGRLTGENRDVSAVLRLSRAARRALRGEESVTVTVRAELMGTRSSRRYVTRVVRLGPAAS